MKVLMSSEHAEEPHPLFLIERDGKSSEAVNANRAFFAYFKRELARAHLGGLHLFQFSFNSS